MKRFYCAIILLILIITSSLYLNIKIEQKSTELINIVSIGNLQEICDCWSENELLFQIALPETYTEPVEENIEKLKSNLSTIQQTKINLIINFKKIKKSIKFNIENIF